MIVAIRANPGLPVVRGSALCAAEIKLYCQFKVNNLLPLSTEVEAIELTECPARLMHRQIVAKKFRVRILAQEEVPKFFEVNAESSRGFFLQVLL